MQYADVLNKATVWPEVPQSRFRPLPGRPVIFMCAPPEKSEGGILLPDRTSGNSRPDAGVVACATEIPVGTRVYVRPYVGLYVDHEEGWYRITGREVFQGDSIASVVSIWEHIVAFDEDGEVIPAPENIMVEWDEPESVIIQIKPPKETATIVKVHESCEDYEVGQRVTVSNSGDWLQIGNHWIIPESDIGVIIE